MADELNNQYQGTQGHEQEVIKVEGLKASLQKMKDDLLGIPNTSEAVKYTQAEADAYNAQLTGALDDTTPLTAEQATAYNTAIAGATKEAGDTLSEAEANLYNATLDGAVTTDDVKTPAVPTKVKDYVDTEVAKKYTKPTNGIPKSDLASGVKTSLGKADTSVQGVAYDTTNKKITKTINGSTTDVVTASAIVTDGNGVKTAISTTYSALKALRDNSQLVPGQWYRITDFVTTTVQTDTRSAGHAFDIIVFADEANKLNESAFAALHSGDTYFANSKLEAWELRYCIDNDTNRFTWADTTNGKGVIYRMVDENKNDLPYDFKNIQFRRWEIVGGDTNIIMDSSYAEGNTGFFYSAWIKSLSEHIGTSNSKETYSIRYAYTGDSPVIGSSISGSFIDVNGDSAVIDQSSYYIKLTLLNEKYCYCKVGEPVWFNTFDLGSNHSDLSLTDDSIHSNSIELYCNDNKKNELNNIIFAVYETSSDYFIRGNVMKYDCHNFTLGQHMQYNVFFQGCYNIIASYTFNCNRVLPLTYMVVFGRSVQHNEFGLRYGIIGRSITRNTIKYPTNTNYVVIGNTMQGSTIGTCNSSVLGDGLIYCNLLGYNYGLKLGSITQLRYSNIYNCYNLTIDIGYTQFCSFENCYDTTVQCAVTTYNTNYCMNYRFINLVSNFNINLNQTNPIHLVEYKIHGGEIVEV